ncbi:MAG TPA: prolyl oligopeptidase family serine peptidase [Candidatus Rubrimentiphilum sp.]|nr:prolyl oligopeptidase family serine peptidase [Candidatus Rubrimentiphilum sp.]
MKRFLPALTAFALLSAIVPVRAALWPEPNQTTVAKAAPGFANGADPFQWLEDKDGAKSLAWVRAQNAKALPILTSDPHYANMYAEALKIAQATDRIAFPRTINGEIYNFWQDATHVRGIWRKTSLASYRTANPSWTTVLDLDALAASEKANWVWKGANCVEPQETRCLIDLSDGGEDAVTMREFDLTTDKFVPDGFVLDRQKQDVTWLDENTLLVSRAWTPGEVTASGYAYDVRKLTRGQPLSSATPLYKGQPSDVSVRAFVAVDGQGHKAAFVDRGVTFFTSEERILTPTGLEKLNVPEKLEMDGLAGGRLLIKLDQSWNAGGKNFAAGSLVQVPLAQALANPGSLKPALVYAPGPRDTLDGVDTTKNDLILTVYQNVRGRALIYSPAGAGWSVRALKIPDMSSVGVTDSNLQNDGIFFSVQSFLRPTTLYYGNASTGSVAEVKSLPARFNASMDVVEQHEAVSRDGTKVPYFLVRPKNMAFNGRNPTVLTAYGGFLISSTPSYSGTVGKLWLERGGVYVVGNIRGGGEFGPAWHDAGLKTHRQRIYDDFYAIGKDLVTRRITDPRHLGIAGGSNGGLLMGVEFTQHPEMWNAVQIEVPLLDMLRFEKIQAGASWVAEYGSASVPAERAFWQKTSPYQNIKPGVAYPEPYIWTTTKDDRVGPQHARKFAAKLAAMHVPYLFYEVLEGGHGAGANLKESAKTTALGWTYFAMKLFTKV